MLHGNELSRQFYDDWLRPAFEERHPLLLERAAIGVLGNGSDTIGLDDEISRDHCWGPRVNIILTDQDYEEFGTDLLYSLKTSLPETYEGFPVAYPKMTRAGVSVESIDRFFQCFAGMAEPPETEMGWFETTEADLFHLTGGYIFQDPLGEFTRRRDALSYYPDNVWKKRIADWCLYFTGSTGPYNVHRCSRRGDFIAAEMFFGIAIKRAMELCYLLNRTYAPYTKWMPRLLRNLPRLGKEVEAIVNGALATTDWHERVLGLVEIARLYAKEIYDLGLTEEPEMVEFDPNFANLTLYDSAVQIYETLPPEMLQARFREAEWWETMVREVLVHSDDYFEEELARQSLGSQDVR